MNKIQHNWLAVAICLLGICFGFTIQASAQAKNRGLDRWNFIYTGEGPERHIHIVKDGKLAWTYHDTDGRGEISDALLMNDGNILIAHQYGLKEITQKKEVVWKMTVPEGYEVHSVQPIGKHAIVYVQCGNPNDDKHPTECIVREVPSLREIRRFKLPHERSKRHSVNRSCRLTPWGTFLFASMEFDDVIEFDSNGKELSRTHMHGLWGVEVLDNGNLLLSSSTQGNNVVAEFNREGQRVWEYEWAKDRQYANGKKPLEVQKAYRLPNGNTVISNWFNLFGKDKVVDRNNPPVQFREVNPKGEVVWELSSWNKPADLGPGTTFQLLDQPINRDAMYFGDIKGETYRSKYQNENKHDAALPQNQRRAVLMGNSITDFWKHDWHGDFHPEFFSENGYICRGIAGQRTDEMYNRFNADVVALHPHVAVILAGVNDIGENGGVKYSEKATLTNLIGMVKKAKAAGIRPIVCSILPWGGSRDVQKNQIESLNNKLRIYCFENNVPYVDYYNAMVDMNRDLKQAYRGNKGKDGLHPGRLGYAVMESLLKPAIEAEIEKANQK